MDRRRIAMLILICVAAVPACVAGGQDLQPISDRTRRIEIPGVSILPPQGEGWFLFPVSPREAIPANTLIRFSKRLRDAPPTRAEDARLVLAGVAVDDSGNATSPTPAEFLQAFTGGDSKKLIGEMMTKRQRLIGFEAALDDSLGAICVRYSQLTEITGQFPAFPNLVAITSTRGLYCSHPRWPQYHIDLTYQQIYAKDQEALSLDVESDAFLKSLIFTSVQPVGVPGLRSHIQAAETAYKEQRWSEAEVSFQAALKEAESLGPQNPVLGMTLYYLASTEEKQGRPTEAEPLFRRALDIFDAQSKVNDPEVAHVHGLTLNDLAVMYAIRASSAASRSSKQRQLQEAEGLLLRALTIREESDPSQVGQTLSNLTQLYMDLGRWTEATTSAQRAVSFYERERGPEDEEVVYQLDRLADIYLQQGRIDEAEPVIRRVVASMEKARGPNDQRIATRLESYAVTLRKAGREAEAREVETRARAIRGKAPARP